MERKHWWLSKTFWVNAIAISGIVSQQATGNNVIGPETQALILAVVNLLLRLFTSKKLGK